MKVYWNGELVRRSEKCMRGISVWITYVGIKEYCLEFRHENRKRAECRRPMPLDCEATPSWRTIIRMLREALPHTKLSHDEQGIHAIELNVLEAHLAKRSDYSKCEGARAKRAILRTQRLSGRPVQVSFELEKPDGQAQASVVN